MERTRVKQLQFQQNMYKLLKNNSLMPGVH